VTELQPDVLVAFERDFTDVDPPTAPLLAVEVLSPSTRLIDLNLKKAAYERMGAACFWLIDPLAVELWAYELDDTSTHDTSTDDGAAADAGGQAGFRLVAHVTGEQVFEARKPFPVSVRPGDLLRRTPLAGPARRDRGDGLRRGVRIDQRTIAPATG
jgi:hypothetical protein